jgi:hypothetical protein
MTTTENTTRLFVNYLLDICGSQIIVTWPDNRNNFLNTGRFEHKELDEFKESSVQILSCYRKENCIVLTCSETCVSFFLHKVVSNLAFEIGSVNVGRDKQSYFLRLLVNCL